MRTPGEWMGWTLVILGGLLALAGGVLLLMGHLAGRLPLDVVYRSERVTVWIPIGTSLLLSLVLTIILNVVFWILSRR